MSYTLLTGATGLVGRYVLRNLLQDGRRMAVIVRSGKVASARERVEVVMQAWESAEGRSLPRPVLLEGDLRADNLGLTPADERWIANHCDTAIHSAASMIFREQADGEPHRTNVEGTQRLLELTRRTGIRNFHHVSTAYLCGLRTGRILESELDLGQDAGNVYEASKLKAEKMVRAATWFDKLTVHRPASIVGDSVTGYTTSYHGFYLPLQLAYTMASRIPPDEMGDRFFAKLGLAGNEGKNFVPVDWVAKAITELVRRPECHGNTYHLASPEPVTVKLIQKVIQESIRRWSKRPSATHASEQDLKIFEQLFEHHMQIYESHWRDDPKFDITNTRRALPDLPCPAMDYERMLIMARYPLEQNFLAPKHEEVDIAFDAAGLVERLQAAIAHDPSEPDSRLSLQVNGSGGGQWNLGLRGSRITRIDAGLAPGESGVCYLSTHTLSRLARRETTVADSIGSGRLVLEAPAGQHRQLLSALEQVVGN